MTSGTRAAVVTEVARQLVARDVDRPLRVGIDGACGVGKTTFAAELAEGIETLGRPVVRLDSDGFHHVRARRHRQGRDSARGYYEDAYDLDALRDLVLEPLRTDPSRRYVARVHDLATDDVLREWTVAPRDAIVLFAATFIQRDDLRAHWDEVVYLDATPQRAAERAWARDGSSVGMSRDVYDGRYLGACALYVAEQHPRERASIVIDLDDVEHPVLVTPSAAAARRAPRR